MLGWTNEFPGIYYAFILLIGAAWFVKLISLFNKVSVDGLFLRFVGVTDEFFHEDGRIPIYIWNTSY